MEIVYYEAIKSQKIQKEAKLACLNLLLNKSKGFYKNEMQCISTHENKKTTFLISSCYVGLFSTSAEKSHC